MNWVELFFNHTHTHICREWIPLHLTLPPFRCGVASRVSCVWGRSRSRLSCMFVQLSFHCAIYLDWTQTLSMLMGWVPPAAFLLSAPLSLVCEVRHMINSQMTPNNDATLAKGVNWSALARTHTHTLTHKYNLWDIRIKLKSTPLTL